MSAPLENPYTTSSCGLASHTCCPANMPLPGGSPAFLTWSMQAGLQGAGREPRPQLKQGYCHFIFLRDSRGELPLSIQGIHACRNSSLSQPLQLTLLCYLSLKEVSAQGTHGRGQKSLDFTRRVSTHSHLHAQQDWGKRSAALSSINKMPMPIPIAKRKSPAGYTLSHNICDKIP